MRVLDYFCEAGFSNSKYVKADFVFRVTFNVQVALYKSVLKLLHCKEDFANKIEVALHFVCPTPELSRAAKRLRLE